jgi:hypothetical protein
MFDLSPATNSERLRPHTADRAGQCDGTSIAAAPSVLGQASFLFVLPTEKGERGG